MKIIVTGSRGTIGKTLCPALREKEHEVIECSRSLGYDLTDEEVVENFFSKHRAEALVNLFCMDDKLKPSNSNNVLQFPLKEMRDYLDINVVALYDVCRKFYFWNEYSKGRQLSIVNFSSIYGVSSPDPSLYNDVAKNVGYVVSKAAVIQLSKYLAVHFAPSVRVNSIVLGGVRGEQEKEFVEKYNKKVPLGRMAEPEEIVGLVEFLCSPTSSYCTGGEFTIDGGYTAL